MSVAEVVVEELWTYPVKSLQGVQLDTAQIHDAGFAHDRTFMLVDQSGSFLTQRQVPELAKFAVALQGDVMRIEAPDYGAIDLPVEGAEGEAVKTAVHNKPCVGLDQGAEAGEFFSGFLGQEVRLLHADQGNPRLVSPNYREASSDNRVDFADGFPFLLTSRSSLDELHRRAGLKYGSVPMNRFRPNIVIDAPALTPFAEDNWAQLRKQNAALFIQRACARCKIPSIIQVGDEAGAKGDVAVLTEFLSSRRGIDLADPDQAKGRFFGQNVVHSAESIGLSLRVGDRLVIVEAAAPNIALAT